MKGCSVVIHSREGITQGNPLSMFIYAIAVIRKLNSILEVIHCGMLMIHPPFVACPALGCGLIF
jgi:hypothetical protein